MMTHTISTTTALREINSLPSPDALAVRCVLPRLDTHHRAFIALSPFLVLASANAQGMPEVSLGEICRDLLPYSTSTPW